MSDLRLLRATIFFLTWVSEFSPSGVSFRNTVYFEYLNSTKYRLTTEKLDIIPLLNSVTLIQIYVIIFLGMNSPH